MPTDTDGRNQTSNTLLLAAVSVAAFAGSSSVAVFLQRRRRRYLQLQQEQHESDKKKRTKKKMQPVRRVAVIGAGIGGLSVAHALLMVDPPLDGADGISDDVTEIDVTVYESRPGLEPNVGAGFVLNGGLATMGKINPAAQLALLDAGNTIEGMEGRCKPWFGSSSKDGDDYYKLFDIPLRKLIRRAGKEAEDALLPNDRLLFTFIMRGACQQVLYDTLPSSSSSDDYDESGSGRKKKNKKDDIVRFGKVLVGIEPNGANSGGDGEGRSGAWCVFSDGTREGPFDLIVGSDGVRSSVREYVDRGSISNRWQQQRDSSSASASSHPLPPSSRSWDGGAYYSGLRVSYAVQETEKDEDADEPGVATVNLGDGAFCLTPIFGTGKGKPNARCVFSVYMDEDYIGPFRFRRSRTEPAGSPPPPDRTTEEWREFMLQQLRDYSVPRNEPGKVLAKADRFFELGVYFHNPYSPWTKEVPGSNGAYAVLIGDAAHAMPPFLGQGANQTVQDAYSLAQLVKQYNRRVSAKEETTREFENGSKLTDFGLLLKYHEKARKRVVSTIVYRTLLLGYLNLGGPFGIYSKLRDVLFRSLGLFQSAVMSAAMPRV